jgi:2-polyprenyl-3-methyl-5-hydroxy-6-metoxy-1,4-benzoquinol methylase
VSTPAAPINKTMDRSDLERSDCATVAKELDELVGWLDARGLQASSWYGTLGPPTQPWEGTNRGYAYRPLPGAADDARFPWFLYWEIAWVAVNNGFRPGDSVLDLGGSSSLFSYYLASRGLEVTTVDLSEELVANAEEVAHRTGWKLRNVVMDMRALALPGGFDHATSICVLEHIPASARVGIGSRLGSLVRPGGSVSLTFDYLNPSRTARISSPADIREQVVEPSGLQPRGNAEFHDNGERYLLSPFHHPRAWWRGWKLQRLWRGQFGLGELARTRLRNDYTFAAFFLERPTPNASR